MQVGDLIKYTWNGHNVGVVYKNNHCWNNQQLGTVTKMDGNIVWWTDTKGYASWTHILNLELISASR